VRVGGRGGRGDAQGGGGGGSRGRWRLRGREGRGEGGGGGGGRTEGLAGEELKGGGLVTISRQARGGFLAKSPLAREGGRGGIPVDRPFGGGCRKACGIFSYLPPSLPPSRLPSGRGGAQKGCSPSGRREGQLLLLFLVLLFVLVFLLRLHHRLCIALPPPVSPSLPPSLPPSLLLACPFSHPYLQAIVLSPPTLHAQPALFSPLPPALLFSPGKTLREGRMLQRR
jgi:hypothetical protein